MEPNFKNVYFFNGTAYAGKSTMVKLLAQKYDGIVWSALIQKKITKRSRRVVFL